MAIPGDIYIAGPAVNPRRAQTHPCTMELARIRETRSTKQLMLELKGALKNDGRRVEIDVDVKELMKTLKLEELDVLRVAVNLELAKREGRPVEPEAPHPCRRKHKPKIEHGRGKCERCEEDLGWYCPKSGTMLCVYNDADDPCHDHCIWCGLPEERL